MEYQVKRTLSLLVLLISEPCIAGEYSDCILENMKGVGTPAAVFQVKKACEEKVLPYVPEKCSIGNDYSEFNLAISKACINKCLNASYWDKHFGDCKE
jgi:hypothetical protein